jgi:hypothetical protein
MVRRKERSRYSVKLVEWNEGQDEKRERAME